MVRKTLGKLGLIVAFVGALGAVNGCKEKCEKPGVNISEPPVPAYSADGRVESGGWVQETDSVTRLGCSPERILDPEESNANPALIVEVSAGGKTNRGTHSSYVEFWPPDWDKLEEADAIYCSVFMPEYCVFSGPAWNPQLEYCVPEHKLYSYYIPLDHYCRPTGDDTYCGSGYWDDGWHCTDWHKSALADFRMMKHCSETDEATNECLGEDIVKFEYCYDRDEETRECTDKENISVTGAAIKQYYTGGIATLENSKVEHKE